MNHGNRSTGSVSPALTDRRHEINGDSSASTLVSPVDSAFNALESVQSNTAELLDLLEQRLRPVLRPLPDSTPTTSERQAGQSPLDDRLLSAVGRQIGAATRLANLLDALTL